MSWCTIESDPGVFTELVSTIGVKNVQFAELWDLEKETFDKLKPIYGLIFLFKWQKDTQESNPTYAPIDGTVYFARQMINNACATQAILNILLNRSDLDLGDELRNFKDFTQQLPPDMCGETIGNSNLIRTAHNSFARADPFESDEKAPATDDDEVYHFIGYVPVNGQLYELDGLKKAPIMHGACTEETWLDVARPVIQARIQKYAATEIRFTLLAIVKNRTQVYNERLQAAQQLQGRLLHKLQQLSANSNSNNEDVDMELPNNAEDLQAALHANQLEQKELEAGLAEEEERFAKWKVENIRRKHNYVPLIYNLVKVLADKGKLQGLVEEAKKVQEKQLAERKAKKEKEKEKEREAAANKAKDKESVSTASSQSTPKA